jgi:hypothetical protein
MMRNEDGLRIQFFPFPSLWQRWRRRWQRPSSHYAINQMIVHRQRRRRRRRRINLTDATNRQILVEEL